MKRIRIQRQKAKTTRRQGSTSLEDRADRSVALRRLRDLLARIDSVEGSPRRLEVSPSR